jgi:Raf kinase inhibitor-like YbhB/YbcL family protein
MEFKLTSPAFNHGSQIPSKYTCDGDNINPHLVIHGVPPTAKSLALIVEDPDAPTGLWTHWVIWNISPELKEIREHVIPNGAQEGVNTRGEVGYYGPCPPSGSHRYFFRLFALDMKITLSEGAGRRALDTAMEQHVVATAELMGTYSRTNEAPV